jgi:hypothetical protein
MDGVFVKIERMPARPAYVVGERVYKALKYHLENQLITDGLNCNMLYQNEGTELTTGNWLIAQEMIEQLFTQIKSEHADKPEFESLQLRFIDSDETGEKKILSKPQLN